MDTLGRLDLACEGFRARLVAVTEMDLARATPCGGWTVGDLVDHTISTLRYAADAVGAPGVTPGGTRVERFDAATRELRSKATDPELAATVVETPFGALALKQLVSSIVVHDVVVHTWDLARATGQDEALDSGLVEHTLSSMRPFDAALRGHGFADAVPAPQGADSQTELLCFLGRRP